MCEMKKQDAFTVLTDSLRKQKQTRAMQIFMSLRVTCRIRMRPPKGKRI